ncbi:ankyrin repeat and protein kinase domain-containing protein [Anaeramoeba ignava]|uniref:Ankyrin repeat and protein kinase domain-containing protein n=1 Tax=Anaeramoeba ignava TaxID=1746090 RepID=A0A9Q0LFZ0_ANAIG|nr:ankyrin repeat and protein kinase domain-containing protein [Anaeramoeba ignava]
MNEKTSSFLISCEKGKEDEVKKMINKFKNPKEINQLSRSGETALHISIAKNYIEVAKILISSGIDINLPETTSGLTPLQYSCWFNKISFVNLLISEKAKLQIKDQRGWNCLHWASFSNNSEIIESLLDADSSLISVTNNAGNYPINIAITENRFQSFSTLIQKITPITQMNKKGFLPIHLLAKNSRVEMMKEIMKFKEKIDLNALSKAGKTALHYSVLSGNLEIVKILVQNDAKVNVVDENYLTPYVEAERNNFFEICNYLQKNSPQFPLHEMIKQGNIKKIRSFLKYKERETDKEKDKEKEMDFDDFDLEGNRPLHLSIQKGNIKIVKELLKKKNQINSIDRTKCSPLSLSINEGKVQIFNLLLQQNPDFSFQDLEGNTFLHTAILQNQDDIAKIILEKSLVDINPTNHQQITPLHLCSKTGNSVMIGELLKFGANPNLLDSENQTPLGIAIQNGHIQVIFMLLTSQTKIPVNLNIQDSKGRSFLMLAIKKHQIETAKLLIKKNSNINLNDKEGNNALHYAIEEEQAEILQNLIEKGIEVKPTADKIPPLHLCIKFNKNLGCFKTLLNSGLDVNLTDHKGNTTLHYAVMFSKPKFLSWIQLISTNIDAFNSNGWTALHLAAGNGQILSLKFLITKGAKIDCQNDQQKTPLHLASSNRHFECVKLLVNFGADLAIKDLHGKIPFDLANKDWHEKIAEYLLLKGSPSPLKEAILSTDEENVKKLISENYLMDIIDSEGNTYLHYALSSKNPKIFEIILEKTENPNVMNKKREYPLHLAVQWGDVAICKRLLQAGADLLLPHPEERPHILATKYNSPCKELVNKEFQRVSSILELVETERNYVFSIKDLLDIVIVPLMKTFSQNEDILPLLENVEQIVNANVSLLNQFELKIANWNYDVGIGDVMTDFAPTMTKYADFNLNYEMLKNTIKRKMSGNNPFANLSKTTSIGMSQEKLSLDSVLIKPVQRIAQYPLLLQGGSEINSGRSSRLFFTSKCFDINERICKQYQRNKKKVRRFVQN